MRKSAMNWTGHGDQLIGIHAMLGFLLVLSLWAIAAIAARSGVSIGLVALAVAYGLAVPILAGAPPAQSIAGDRPMSEKRTLCTRLRGAHRPARPAAHVM